MSSLDIDAVSDVVRTDHLGLSLDRDPVPASPRHDGGVPALAYVDEFSALAACHKADDGLTGQRV